MKKTVRSNKRGRNPRGKPRTSNPGPMPEPNNITLFDPWVQYSKQLETQIVDVLEENKTQYERLYNGWNDFSKNMGVKMKTTVGDDSPEYKELFNVWKNYSNKIGTRLTKLVEDNRSNVETLTNEYKDYSTKIVENIMILGIISICYTEAWITRHH